MRTALFDELTQDGIVITKSLDGARNTTLFVSGDIRNEPMDTTFSITDVTELAGNPTSLRLDNVTYVLEEGLKIIITYQDEPYFIPLAGRGKLELDKLGGLMGHQLEMTFKGMGCFFVGIDISKLGV